MADRLAAKQASAPVVYSDYESEGEEGEDSGYIGAVRGSGKWWALEEGWVELGLEEGRMAGPLEQRFEWVGSFAFPSLPDPYNP